MRGWYFTFFSLALHIALGWLLSQRSGEVLRFGAHPPSEGIEISAFRTRSIPVVPLAARPAPFGGKSDRVKKGEALQEGRGTQAEESVSLGLIASEGNRLPEYPEEARRRGWEGTVSLRLFFLEGRVREVEVAETSGFAILDKAALEPALSWRLQRLNGPRILPVRFLLKGEG